MKASRAEAGASGSRLEISILQLLLYICIVARDHNSSSGHWYHHSQYDWVLTSITIAWMLSGKSMEIRHEMERIRAQGFGIRWLAATISAHAQKHIDTYLVRATDNAPFQLSP